MSESHRPILLLGSRGMLGRAWHELLERRGVPFRALGRPELDLAEPATVERLDGDYAAIVNCAAWTDVDGAESREEAARRVNAVGVAALAQRARALGATLLHYSTDYVFNGRGETPYRVDHPRDPVNAYGRTKAEGEEAIERSGCRYLLIRTSWVYAPWGKNFVLTMHRLTAERDTLRVVDDQRGRPTSAEHLAAASLALLERGATGTYHVTDGGACTWCGFTREIARLAGHACDVQPCTTAEFPRPAPRPAYSVLDLSKTEAMIGPMPDWRDNLLKTMDRITG